MIEADPQPTGPRPNTRSGSQGDRRETVIPVVEEQVQVGKRIVPTGSVRFTKKIHEEDITINEPIVQEEVDVERVEINQFVETPPPPVRHEGDKMIISVLREEIVVQKRLFLVEELHVTRRFRQEDSSQNVTVRKEEVHVDRNNTASGMPGSEA